MKHKPINNLLVKVIAMFVAAFLVACAINPLTGKKEVALMSENQEIALGAESDPQIIAQFGLYEDKEIQSFIETHGLDMVKVSHRSHLKFHFRILDSPVVNAFAVPGGYIYFTRGIMAHFNNEAAFAGVLGHEIGHVSARHSVDQYTKSILAQVLLAGGMLVSKELRIFADEAESAMQLLFLKYSRDNESQSDELGVEYSTKVGYDSKHMADFFKTLNSLSEAPEGEAIPPFLSTHPNPLDRYKKVNELTTEWQSKVAMSAYKVNRDNYLRMIDGIVYGEDPRQGFVESNTFYHPSLKFQFPLPSDWNYMNTPTRVQVAPDDGKALMMLTLAEGNNLQAAANNTSTALELSVTGSKQISVNGLPALEVMSQQVSMDPSTQQEYTIRVQSIYIQYNNLIYVFHGVALDKDFPTYDHHFDKTMYGFKELKDQAKLNVVPERIKVVKVVKTGTLGQALNANNVPTSRHRELGIINGMDVTDQVAEGALIKILAK